MRPLLDLSDGYDAARSSFVWRIPPDFNLAEVCCHSWARAAPDRVALVDLAKGQNWTYGQLSRGAYRLAHVLRGLGVARGACVALLLPQRPEVILGHVACHTLGAVSLPLFTLFGADALSYRLEDSGAAVVLTDAAGAERVRSLDLSQPPIVIDVDRDLPGLLARASDSALPPQAGADDPAVMIYTSGTTGAPKGVLHAHRFLLGHMPSIEMTHLGFGSAGEVAWTPADWAWIGGLMDLALPSLARGVVLVAHRMAKFDADAAFAVIRDQAVSRLFLPPTAMRMMALADPLGARAKSISSGGEALSDEMRLWGQEALGAEVNELYGQTECNLTVSSSAGIGLHRSGAMGKPVPGVSLRLLDATGEEVSAGDVGEICVHRDTPAMFLKYWNKPGATADRFRGEWLRTGDLARADVDGYLTYVARDDDLISSAGYRIGPSEIEACLMADADVILAGVVGEADEMRGQVVVAHVTLVDGADRDGLEARLIASVKDRISPHVAPRRIVICDSLPMTTTGKILRRELRGG